MLQRIASFAALGLLALAFGCASDSNISPLMDRLGKDAYTPVPLRGQAVVVFMRPTDESSSVQSTLYDMQQDGDHFVGVVSAETKVAFITPAGSHLFMVIGENADFMNAELLEGKTYYALVLPRKGVLKSRFSIRPVRKRQIGTPEFEQWESGELLRCGTDCERWVRNNVNSIVGKRSEYLAKWNRKSEVKRRAAGLLPEDGYP